MSVAPTLPMKKRGSAGFTLIEVLVVVAIVGILSTVAYPAYGRYLMKGNRAAAQAHLIDLAQAESQYFADARGYAATTAALNVPTPAAVAAKYAIRIDVSDTAPPGFTITATPTGSQADDGILTVDQSGARTPAGKW
jgi:type IV pilus assembly protein PilE